MAEVAQVEDGMVIINCQPRPQGLLAFQHGGGRREDPGTQQKSRDWFVHGSGNLFKMAAKVKSERIWVRDLETGEKQTKWRQRQNSKEAKNMKEYTYKPQEYGRMI